MKNITGHTTNSETATGQEEVVISVKHVSKKFCRHLKRSMIYGLLDLSRSLVGLKLRKTDLRPGEFWALQDLTFEMKRGESLGVLGLNGSGKTTLLRMLSGIFPPDKGEIMIRGRVGTLISMGAGFHPHMTGRENIYVNGSILGLSRAELDAHFDDIVDFAEVGDFLDAPVSTYSNGMRVRLGFAIATAVVPDVLLLDEVFAVGDVVFRQRCIERMQNMIDDAAVILVSNRPEFIELLCERALWLDKGKVVANGEVEEVSAFYTEQTSHRSALFAMQSGKSRGGNGDIRFTDTLKVFGAKSGTNTLPLYGESLVIETAFVCRKPWSKVQLSIELIDLALGMPLTIARCKVPEIAADGTLHCTFFQLPLLPRSYAVTLKIMHGETALDIWRYAAHFTAKRPKPKPSSKVKKYPHEFRVDIDGAVYEHSYKKPPSAQPSAPIAK